MSISLFWLERGGRWGSSPLTSLADHQKLNVIQKWAFHIFGWRGVVDGIWVHRPARPIIRSWMQSKNKHFTFLAGERWQMGLKSFDQPGRSSEVELNPKTSISLFWLERGGRQGSSPLTSPADHQKFNVIQKWAFHFFGYRGVVDGIRVHRPARQIIRSWMQSKNKHFTFLAGEGWQVGFESIDQPGRSLEVECNPKMNISLFWLERGGGWGSSPLTSLADHQKLDIIQKWTFHFFG